MSGPVEEQTVDGADLGISTIEVKEGRTAQVGDMHVVRVLPTKKKRAVGPWCFLDLMSPDDIDQPPPIEIGPHPHIGLATVTWLFAGTALHGDSLGTEQVIRPGQLNLMTAGHGIAHSELSGTDGVLGVQMWIAQPEETRHGTSAFEHHASVPRVELANGEGSLLVGSFQNATSPARADTALVGVDVNLAPGVSEVHLQPTFEYGIVPIDNPV